MDDNLRTIAVAGQRVLAERRRREREKQLEAARLIEEHRKRVLPLVLAALPEALHSYCSVDPIAPGSLNAFALIDLSSIGGGTIRAKYLLSEKQAHLEGSYVIDAPDGRQYTDEDIHVAVALALVLPPTDESESNID